MTDPDLERWRLVLGEAGNACLGGQALSAEAGARDAALDWLYGRDEDLDRRGVRRGGSSRHGGDGASTLTTVTWLDDITRLFPKETVERLQRDAVERYEIHDVVTDPAVLQRVEPNPALLKAVLRTKHLMNPDVLRLARRIVETVVRQLTERLATEVRAAFTGARARRPSRFRQARNFDVRRTIRNNLAHYRVEDRRLYIDMPYFFSRTRRHVDQWQVILLVDQSGSMTDSVIHSAVTAACLWGLPGVRTHLIAFDTDVVDLTSDVDDPVELLMKVQLGGGTDIARAVDYAAQLIEQPRRTIVALISDFYEGGSEGRLVCTVRSLVEQGTRVLGLAALDEQANPAYDRALAQRLADVGASVGAMTPGELATFVAEQVGR
ncbi:VWA domain containing CoxE-like protein [Micromonospora kangleipakensis]|uniref:VWA domain containing CoxE-like protein n=1 Tax=Micromonospora kangleipakensis TaxID=1077942 RepID=A0A4V2GDN9_9ACTN|nr:VWA domain-containing protein [Micromonospora kangleipakensis]RZU76656.1 VWA domain containing CoxE-like protein [Micromonospora kangleipakensis]